MNFEYIIQIYVWEVVKEPLEAVSLTLCVSLYFIIMHLCVIAIKAHNLSERWLLLFFSFLAAIVFYNIIYHT